MKSNRLSKGGAAGGPGSRQVVKKPVHYGDRARAISEKGSAQIGSSRGNKATESGKILRKDVEPVRLERRPSGTPGSIPLGNEVAGNVIGKAGPGAGRVLFGQSGSQQQYGKPDAGIARPQSQDIFDSFKPDSPTAKARGVK